MLKTKGYTLIEMLFVISLMSMLSLITINNHELRMNNKDTIEHISLFFIKAKSHAIVNKEQVDIVVKHNKIKIECLHMNNIYHINQGLFLDSHKFHYNEKGHIYKAKTLSLKLNNHLYDYIFQLGSGTFYVKDKGQFID